MANLNRKIDLFSSWVKKNFRQIWSKMAENLHRASRVHFWAFCLWKLKKILFVAELSPTKISKKWPFYIYKLTLIAFIILIDVFQQSDVSQLIEDIQLIDVSQLIDVIQLTDVSQWDGGCRGAEPPCLKKIKFTL